MLALEGGEPALAEQRRVAAPYRLPRDNEAAEIFEEPLELRIAGGVGDFAVECEVLVNRGLAAPDRRFDLGKALADLLELRGRGALGGKARRLDFDAGAQFQYIENVLQRRILVELEPERPADLLRHKGADALPGNDEFICP